MLVSPEEAADILDRQNAWRAFQVEWPEASAGNYAIEIFEIEPHAPGRLRFIEEEGPERDPGSGTFRRLVETVPGAGPEGADARRVWMSDSRAEIREHMPILDRLVTLDAKGIRPRVLVHGLGLGMVVQAAVVLGAEHVDVVEINSDVSDLVGPNFDPDIVTIWNADAFEMKWPNGHETRWHLAWHDIWPSISDENIPGMRRLMKRYKPMVGWQGCWQYQGSLKIYKIMEDMQDGTLDPALAIEFILGYFNPNKKYPRR